MRIVHDFFVVAALSTPLLLCIANWFVTIRKMKFFARLVMWGRLKVRNKFRSSIWDFMLKLLAGLSKKFQKFAENLSGIISFKPPGSAEIFRKNCQPNYIVHE